ncbi:putative metallo-peptidase Clan MA(E) Family M3 [Leptomonas pyrrhocoris]|uniref:Putative metallo-peptidase Clan MA(E) Family M3 n=1 Tax=Leptomonas pyrrhocoris TaxID=157538 RepID=A0A0N0DRQ7_LEPPY|nr:putative metallo-peptidase Clan MA(E) Family M3 [Leptomonas pyrrhocoris]XP_015659171.1 putative metallo-peptidase Clan MA(E) Family M3 [Leptomonas pyrrhocoris]KPA74811.1 putative metallo-peptidase Clan MA(E) Family M3 [Leptomonas pyrrhocoris]KPA80732.1 putative metallo-peptidase Clan MA(E) Family M3 [Leptomonas pyrrhocoris]|eukprot:XP_015653250.1 putative metallo-peptidase Clan MA(E) Family M3 [Leptomonas pyrrhocoris]
MQHLEETYAAEFSAYTVKIYLDPSLDHRTKAVYDDRGGLAGEDLRLVVYYEEQIRKAGAGLDDAGKGELKQVNEHWAMYDEVLRDYAIHCETREPITQAPVGRVRAAETYGAGFRHLEVTKASIIDMH